MQGLAPTPTNSINEYDFSALDEIQAKEFNLNEAFREMLFYILPILSFVFFMFIVFSAVIPSIQSMNTKMDEIDKLNTDLTTLNQRIVNIQTLATNNEKIQSTIEKINNIVPTGRTEVVKFGERISNNIAVHSLLNTTLKTGETVLVTNDSSTTSSTTTTELNASSLPLSEIPTKFDIQGSFSDIRSFFISLYKGQDFFVVDKMELNSAGENRWFGDVSLVKYQFSPSSNFDPVKAYQSVSETSAINPQVVTFLEKKFIGNAFEGNVVTPTPTVTPTTTVQP